MSYDVMAYQSLREMVITIDPERTDSIMKDDIVIMCNKDKVKCLSGMKYILMDGTFSVAPPGFMQVYTIHGGFDKGIHFTLFYVVMKRRREDDYRRVFSRIQQFCIEEFNFSLFNEGRIVITDYEKVVFAALKQYGCRMQGCIFHFAQCVQEGEKSRSR